MKIEGTSSEASSRTCLHFSKEEVINILKNHAMKNGYIFDGEVFIWFPTDNGRKDIRLVIDKKGSTKLAIELIN